PMNDSTAGFVPCALQFIQHFISLPLSELEPTIAKADKDRQRDERGFLRVAAERKSPCGTERSAAGVVRRTKFLKAGIISLPV
ncbi:MAG: hypothetical protein IJ100_05720, partial [Lachnospiraceae bacterium]|nr:hypothetical protein [Lachnospiraceae bacterium]